MPSSAPLLIVIVFTPHLASSPLDGPLRMQQSIHDSTLLIPPVPMLPPMFPLILVLLPFLLGKVRADGSRDCTTDGSQSAPAVFVA